MRQELQDGLIHDFPALYGTAENPNPCDYACEDGWEPLLRRLSARLHPIIMSLPDDERSLHLLWYMKEKFGELRYYLHKATPEMQALIGCAVEEASRTCEKCGAPGVLRTTTRGYLQTLCEGKCSKGTRIVRPRFEAVYEKADKLHLTCFVYDGYTYVMDGGSRAGDPNWESGEKNTSRRVATEEEIDLWIAINRLLS